MFALYHESCCGGAPPAAALARCGVGCECALVQALARVFEGWMAQGGHAVSAADSFPELRAKFFARVASWAAGILEEHSTMYSVLSFFGQTEGIDVSELARDLGAVSASRLVWHTSWSGRRP
eukprot:Sspe_Gene.12681::Locus_4333_Transcript_1_1_Confidence_1.000_Length_2083::g.12681::m.12681